MAKMCKNCGTVADDMSMNCPNCGAALEQAQQPMQQQVGGGQYMQGQQPTELKSKLVAGLLGIFLGGWGIHNFYLGNTSRAVIQIVVTLVTCGMGSLWGLIEGIMILCGKINTDANGNPLKD